MTLRRILHLAVAVLAVTTAAQLPVLGLLANGGSAQIVLVNASGTLAQTADTPWTLDKTGALSGATVTWDILATPGTTTTNRLQVLGQMTVANAGTGPATIGNIVVNLQHRVGSKWVTVASDVANATDGDAATVARIHAAGSSEGASIVTENAASGALEFMDATSNTIFSLVPQVLIGAGETRPLLFTAAFDNSQLNFTPGTLLRAEVIVSFGNATAKGNSTANLDINGNGSLDADEARVRSVPTRFTAPVPAPVTGNDEVTLSDTLSDITSTGTVSFSNVVFNLGETTGTVSAMVDGGANGGTITNCAHLTSADQTATTGGFALPLLAGVNLQACSTVPVAPTPICTAGTPGCGWRPGDLVSFGHGQWGTPGTTAGNLLASLYNTVYFSSGGLLEVGIAGAGGFSIAFSGGAAVGTYLPSVGTPAALTGDVLNPTSTSSGILGGEVTSLALNVDFSAAGVLGGALTNDFGTLLICGAAGLPSNISVAGFLVLAEETLGGANTGVSPSTIQSIAQSLNTAFLDGTPSTFAQHHLVNAATCDGWAAGDFITYPQAAWGDASSVAGTTLIANYGTVYFATFGVLEVGIPGSAGFSVTFTTPSALIAYFPQTGVSGPLTFDSVNASTTSSGSFGGQVTALQLNVDFSDVGVTAGTAGVAFGDLRVCGTSVPEINGTTVRDVLSGSRVLLGGGTSNFSVSAIELILAQLNVSFGGGTVSAFARAHLVNGGCP